MLRTEFPNGQVAVIKAIEMLLPLTCLGVVCGSCHNDLAGIEFAAGGEVATSRNYPTNQARADLNRTGCGVRLPQFPKRVTDYSMSTHVRAQN